MHVKMEIGKSQSLKIMSNEVGLSFSLLGLSIVHQVARVVFNLDSLWGQKLSMKAAKPHKIKFFSCSPAPIQDHICVGYTVSGCLCIYPPEVKQTAISRTYVCMKYSTFPCYFFSPLHPATQGFCVSTSFGKASLLNKPFEFWLT